MKKQANTQDQLLLDQWFTRQNLTPATRESYTYQILNYLSTTPHQTLNDLIEEAEHEETNNIRPRNRRVNQYIYNFKNILEERGRAPQTIRGNINTVKGFYRAFDITTPNIRLPHGDNTLEKNEKPLPTREEIHYLASLGGTRHKAIIYTMALSGMAQQELRNLTINNLLHGCREVLNEDIGSVEELFKYEKQLKNEIIPLHLTRQKVQYRYITFLPYEVLSKILKYLREREAGANPHIRIKNSNDWLFVKKDGQQMTKPSILNMFLRYNQKAGNKDVKGTYRKLRSHTLRKYFISTIINKTGDHILADYLSGHKIDPLKRAYWKADPESLKQRYLIAYPHLSIDGVEVKEYKTEEFIKIEKDNTELRNRQNVLENTVDDLLTVLKKYPDDVIDRIRRDEK